MDAFHYEKLHNVYFSPDITRISRSPWMGWAGDILCMRWKRSTHKAVAGTPDLQIPLKNLDVNVKVIFKYILKEDGMALTKFIWLKTRISDLFF